MNKILVAVAAAFIMAFILMVGIIVGQNHKSVPEQTAMTGSLTTPTQPVLAKQDTSALDNKVGDYNADLHLSDQLRQKNTELSEDFQKHMGTELGTTILKEQADNQDERYKLDNKLVQEYNIVSKMPGYSENYRETNYSMAHGESSAEWANLRYLEHR